MAIAVFVPLVAVLATALFTQYGSILVCPVNAWTGLYCPGCGSGRAIIALTRLHVGDAFGYNPAFVLLLPLVACHGFRKYLALVLSWNAPPAFAPSVKTGRWLVALMLLYGVVRNIPFWPFTWLAP